MNGSRPLERFWEQCTPQQAADAPGLIARYMGAAQRQARFLSCRYPREDVEPRVMYALYKTAYTYRPGKAGFIPWLNSKIRGETSMLRVRAAYKEKYRIKIERLDPDVFDIQRQRRGPGNHHHGS